MSDLPLKHYHFEEIFTVFRHTCFPSHDFCRNFCSACAVTVVVFGHLNYSFYLLRGYKFLVDRTAACSKIGGWHHRVVCHHQVFGLGLVLGGQKSLLTILASRLAQFVDENGRLHVMIVVVVHVTACACNNSIHSSVYVW